MWLVMMWCETINLVCLALRLQELLPQNVCYVINALRPSLFYFLPVFRSRVVLWMQTGEAWERSYIGCCQIHTSNFSPFFLSSAYITFRALVRSDIWNTWPRNFWRRTILGITFVWWPIARAVMSCDTSRSTRKKRRSQETKIEPCTVAFYCKMLYSCEWCCAQRKCNIRVSSKILSFLGNDFVI